MGHMRALQVCYVTGVTTFCAAPGTFYRVDCSAAQVTATLPPISVTQPGDWLGFRNIAGANDLIVAGYNGGNAQEYIDLSTTFTINATNHKMFWANSPPGYYPTPGWMSF